MQNGQENKSICCVLKYSPLNYFFFFYLCVYLWFYLCECIFYHTYLDAVQSRGGHQILFMELLAAVSHLTCVLGREARSSSRAESVLKC